MDEENDKAHVRQALRNQLVLVDKLRGLPFDDPTYQEWRAESGRILDQLFGKLQEEAHPCTKAFLNYQIPERFIATRKQMQEFYQNILRYQADLLTMYLEDIQEEVGGNLRASS